MIYPHNITVSKMYTHESTAQHIVNSDPYTIIFATTIGYDPAPSKPGVDGNPQDASTFDGKGKTDRLRKKIAKNRLLLI